MSEKVSGTFEVKLDAQGAPDKREGATLGRMSIDKRFEGPLDAEHHRNTAGSWKAEGLPWEQS